MPTPSLRLLAGTNDPTPLDLSRYLRLAEDEGLDPADPDFLSPAFADSALGDGSDLINVAAANKELVWPLHLSAIDVPALHDLVVALRRKLNEPGLIVQWQTTGASNPTYWDLEYGRWDGEYRHWRSAAGFTLSGTLRCWARPYGHTATSRLVATSANRGLVVATVAALRGDAPAQLSARMTASQSTLANKNQAIGVLSVIGPRTAPLVTPSQMTINSTGTVVGDGGGVDGRAYRQAWSATTTTLTKIDVAPGAYEERHRVMVLAKAARDVTINAELSNDAGREAIGATQSFTNGLWNLLDLGVMDLGSDPGAPTMGLYLFAGKASGVATQTLNITQTYLLPEERTTVGVIDSPPDSGVLTFAMGYDTNPPYVERLAAPTRRRPLEQRGELPQIPADGDTYRVCALTYLEDSNVAVHDAVEIRVRERFTYLR